MVRPLCIEYADAWYHIMNRDRRSESIFDEEDISKVFKKKKWPAILGSRDFINRIKERFFTEKANESSDKK